MLIKRYISSAAVDSRLDKLKTFQKYKIIIINKYHLTNNEFSLTTNNIVWIHIVFFKGLAFL